MKVILETDRLLLRQHSEEDAEEFFKLTTDQPPSVLRQRLRLFYDFVLRYGTKKLRCRSSSGRSEFGNQKTRKGINREHGGWGAAG